jgi:N-acetylneuraminic acid mutarotase
MSSRMFVLITVVIAPLFFSACGGSNGTKPATATSAAHEWTWVGGPNLVNQAGTYGTLGVAAPVNVPGARSNSISWSDASGNFWLFGGSGFDSAGNAGDLNDLWNYSAGQWTWMGGSNLCCQPGTYGTQGTAAPGNVPGARELATKWTDASGNLWLFGGYGFDSAGSNYMLNDLWKYSAGQWTWMGGSSFCCQPGSYGTQGTADAGNLPGPRWSAVSWTDVDGNFWLYGGLGFGSFVTSWGNMDDLWEYSGGEWTWMSGASTPVFGVAGTYGTEGTAAPGNSPGTRFGPAVWNASGNLLFFGGNGDDSNGQLGDLSDLWQYAAGEWTWIGGANICCQTGTYGTLGYRPLAMFPGRDTLPSLGPMHLEISGSLEVLVTIRPLISITTTTTSVTCGGTAQANGHG